MCLDLFTCLREGLSLTQHNLEKKTTWHMGPEDPSKSSSEFHFDISPIVQPARETLGLLLADGVPTVGGGRLFDGSLDFFTKTAVTL